MSTPIVWDPFKTTDSLNPPSLDVVTTDGWHGFQFDPHLECEAFKIPEDKQKALPELQPETFKLDLEDVALPSTSTSSAASFVSAEEDTSFREEGDEKLCEEYLDDVWSLDAIKGLSRKVGLASWDQLEASGHIEPATTYLSEAGRVIFDGALQLSGINQRYTRLAVHEQYLNAMIELGMGRASLYFAWNQPEERFTPALDSVTVSGYTFVAVQAVVDILATHGRSMRSMSASFTAAAQSRSTLDAARSALISVLRSCHAAIQYYLGEWRDRMRTILEVEQIFRKTGYLVDTIQSLRGILDDDYDDQELLSKLLSACPKLASANPQLEPVLQQILSAVAVPVLRRISIGIGMATSIGSDEYMSMPYGQNDEAAVLPSEVVQLISEAHDCFSLLHQLTPTRIEALRSSTMQGQELTLVFSWAEIIQAQELAIVYEEEGSSAITAFKTTTQPSLTNWPYSESCVQSSNCWELFGIAEGPDLGRKDDQIQAVALRCLSDTTAQLAPLQVSFDEALAMSISPMLSVQHRLLSYAAFEMLLIEHQALEHFKLLYSFGLLGNGIFAARLGIALFDSEQASGEGRRYNGGITGLRLQARDVWPPAGSELRLVLMGILAESMTSQAQFAAADSISFAIRDMSEEDLDKCMNVNSIHALDFLKLQYRPPSLVLEAVVSVDSLDKYDRIFRHLLRVLRLKCVGDQLLRATSRRSASKQPDLRQRFAIESRLWISIMADYSQNVAVGYTWLAFAKTMQDVECKLRQKDYVGTLRLGRSLRHLAQLHDSTLDAMLRALLLKQKQSKALQLVEETFNVILKYAALLRSSAEVETQVHIDNELNLYTQFKGLVKELVQMLHSMIGGDSKVGSGNEAGLDLLEHLLLRLEMNGYWTK